MGALLTSGPVVPLFDRHPLSFPTGPATLSVTGQVLRRNAAAMLMVAVLGALLHAWKAVRTRLLDAIWGRPSSVVHPGSPYDQSGDSNAALANGDLGPAGDDPPNQPGRVTHWPHLADNPR